MTQVEQLAAFVERMTYEDLSEEARHQLKIRILDALGCALGAIEGPPIKMLQAQLEDFGGKPLVTLIGGGKTAPDRAAFYNSALIRYLDYNDSYIAKNETCHPSDNIERQEIHGSTGTRLPGSVPTLRCRPSAGEGL